MALASGWTREGSGWPVSGCPYRLAASQSQGRLVGLLAPLEPVRQTMRGSASTSVCHGLGADKGCTGKSCSRDPLAGVRLSPRSSAWPARASPSAAAATGSDLLCFATPAC